MELQKPFSRLLCHLVLQDQTLQELFRARLGNCSLSDYSSGELTRNSRIHLKEEYANSDTQIQADENNHDNSIGEVNPTQSVHASLNDADDEFYDVMEPSDCDESENGWMAECNPLKFQIIWYGAWQKQSSKEKELLTSTLVNLTLTIDAASFVG